MPETAEARLPSFDEYPDVHRTTLGRWVVAAYEGSANGGMPAGFAGAATSQRMKSSRHRLTGLDPRQSAQFDYICAESVPAELQDIKIMETGAESWQVWLGEKASDAQLLEYLEWHVGSIEDQQLDSGIQQEIAFQRTAYKENIRRGLSEGWLHEAAEAAIEAVDDVPVYVGDVFTTALDEQLAYYATRTGEIVIGGATSIPRPGRYDEVRELVSEVQQHEFNHAVLGRLGARWLNEALTEHVAQTLQYAEVSEVGPYRRSHREAGRLYYAEERMLLKYLLREGSEVIPPRLATIAYSAPSSADKVAFVHRIDAAWSHMVPTGASALGHVDSYVSALEHAYRFKRGLSAARAAHRAVRQTNRNIRLRPEAVFSGSPEPHDPELR